jgi:hypothetical protein
LKTLFSSVRWVSRSVSSFILSRFFLCSLYFPATAPVREKRNACSKREAPFFLWNGFSLAFVPTNRERTKQSKKERRGLVGVGTKASLREAYEGLDAVGTKPPLFKAIEGDDRATINKRSLLCLRAMNEQRVKALF